MTRRGFKAISNRLIVSPIVATLVFSTTPAVARQWVDAICKDWNFRQIIPAHFTAPIQATPADLRAAFSFVYDDASTGDKSASKTQGGILGGVLRALNMNANARRVVYPEDDIRALNSAKEFLKSAGVVNK